MTTSHPVMKAAVKEDTHWIYDAAEKASVDGYKKGDINAFLTTRQKELDTAAKVNQRAREMKIQQANAKAKKRWPVVVLEEQRP
ncbi:hypothetical protein FRB94_013273 [Tulasnella sp. JGI-2019a]|nr:hypothetical protein FRB93_001979 [Tulasnella sp. JGI-2019a]KAG9008449.1 hypothetical protein FRB94_013273 [Tulasnella sp. JGI-2019a]KAG9031452.1 hypothetical protein FRB95_002752 [Tulasnella sp. JGI-2019a]